MKATDCLNAEHGVFLAQLDRLDLINKDKSRQCQPQALQAMVDIVRVALDRHAHIEEAGLYKALERYLGRGQGPLAVMDMEHEEIRKTVLEIASWKPEDSEIKLKRNVAHFSDVLRSHIEKEMRVLFPMAEEMLSQGELEELASGCQCEKDAEFLHESKIEN